VLLFHLHHLLLGQYWLDINDPKETHVLRALPGMAKVRKTEALGKKSLKLKIKRNYSFTFLP
jgi:hypothetical protein